MLQIIDRYRLHKCFTGNEGKSNVNKYWGGKSMIYPDPALQHIWACVPFLLFTRMY